MLPISSLSSLPEASGLIVVLGKFPGSCTHSKEKNDAGGPEESSPHDVLRLQLPSAVSDTNHHPKSFPKGDFLGDGRQPGLATL
jgi:hypothetical protein